MRPDPRRIHIQLSESDQCSNWSEIVESGRDCQFWNQCGGDLAPCAGRDGSGLLPWLPSLTRPAPGVLPRSRLQLPDGFPQSFDRDVQRLCFRLEITLPLCNTLRLGHLFFLTFFWCLLVHSREVIKKLLRCVTVWTKRLRPIEMHTSTCCLLASFVPTCILQFSMDPWSLGFAAGSPNGAAKFLFRLQV